MSKVSLKVEDMTDPQYYDIFHFIFLFVFAPIIVYIYEIGNNS
jgi:hypothetical protein